MFIVSLTYTCDLSDVDKHLNEHIAYLKNAYQSGHFLMSGRKEPRTGGIIIATVDDREALQAILEQDPFYREQLATYEVQAFTPTMAAKGFEALVS